MSEGHQEKIQEEENNLLKSQEVSEPSHVIVSENSPANLGSSVEVVNDLSKSTNSPSTFIENLNTSSNVAQNQIHDQSPFRQSSGHEAHIETTPVGSSHLDSVSSVKLNSSVDQIKEEKAAASPASGHLEQEEDLTTRLSKAIAIKNSAKSLVSQAKYDDAIRVYESAYYALRPTGKDRAHSDFKKCLLLQAELFNNLSFCYGNLERYPESIEYAKRVLFVDGENTKALYRLAVGHKNMGNFMAAYDEIKKAKDIFKRQNPDKPLDGKIHELYASLREICKPDLEKRKMEEKAVYSKMLGTSNPSSPTVKNGNSQPEQKSALSYKAVRYGLCLGPIIILTVIGYNVVKQRTIRAVKRNIPAIVASIGALLILRYIKNNVRGSVWGIGLAIAAALMIQRTSKEGVFYKKTL